MRPIRNNRKINNLDNLFRRNLEKIEAEAPPFLWNTIQSEITPENRPVRDRYYATAALLLLLFTSINLTLYMQEPSWLENEWVTEYIPTFGPEESILPAINNKIKRTAPVLESAVNNPAIPELSTENSSIINTQDTKVVTGTSEEKDNFNSSASSSSENLNRKIEGSDDSEYTGLSVPLIVLKDLDSDDLDNGLSQGTMDYDNYLRNRNINVNGFHLGVIGAFNNTWVLLKKSDKINWVGEDINYDLTFGSSYGLSAGYDFSTNAGVQVEWIMNSNQGQRYEHVLRNSKVKSVIDLNYLHLPILFKYKWSKISALTNKPAVLNYIVGVQFSHLKSATLTMNGDVLQAENKFQSTEAGVVFGLEYDVFVSKNLFFSLGTRGSISSDIKSLPVGMNSSSGKSNNFVIGLNAGVHYLFQKNNKD